MNKLLAKILMLPLILIMLALDILLLPLWVIYIVACIPAIILTHSLAPLKEGKNAFHAYFFMFTRKSIKDLFKVNAL